MPTTVIVINPCDPESTFLSSALYRKNMWHSSKHCHVGIHKKALAEYYQNYPYVRIPVIAQLFSNDFVLSKSATKQHDVQPSPVLLQFEGCATPPSPPLI